MIGQLININKNQAEALKELRKVPFWRRRWFRLLFFGGLLLSLIAAVGFWFYLQPLRAKARAYDLSIINRMEISTVVHDKQGKELAELAEETRRPISMEDVPHHFIQALCSAEDGRFFSHKGVDYLGIGRAVFQTLRLGKFNQGASTITQQLARRAFEGVDKTIAAKNFERKFTEMFLAQRIEENYSKTEIMELYLNRIYLGSSCYGLGAAAHAYFNKSVKDLDLLESATICGLIKRPDKYSPLNDIAAAKRNRDQVLGRMVDEKFLSPMECERLRALPVKINPQKTTKSGSYIVDRVRQEVAPILESLGYDSVTGQGLHIYISIDSNLQKIAEASVKQRLAEIEKRKEYQFHLSTLAEERKKKPKEKARVTFADYQGAYDDWRRLMRQHPELEATTPPPDPNYLQASLMMIDNKTGQVLAMVGGRDYLHNKVNLADSKPGRSTGTAFLPFVYAAAFEDKMFPGTRLNDQPLDNSRIMVGGLVGILGEWGREGQTDTFQRKITARGALVQSMNGASARLGLDIGLPKVRDFANRAGLTGLKDLPASILGASESTVEEVCLGYSSFANGGERPTEVRLIEKIVDPLGSTIWKRPAAAVTKVTDPITAFMVTDCLQDAMEVGTGSLASEEFGLKKMPIAGKSGTHYEFRDLFFAGYTTAVSCAVWVGIKDKPEMIYPDAYSNRCALPIWADMMNAAADTYKPQEFKKPERIETVDLCALSGLRSTDRCYEVQVAKEENRRIYVKTTYKEFIRPGFKLNQSCDVHKDADVGEAIDPDDVPRPPAIVGNVTGGTGSGRNAIPIILKDKTVVGTDPYNSPEPTTPDAGIPRAAPVTDGSPDFRILDAPTLDKPSIQLPEAPPIKID